MVPVPKRAGVGSAGHWLVAACAASVWLAPLAALAQQQQVPPNGAQPAPGNTTGAAAVDFQALNRSLQVERVLAQFFNANADKPYISATAPPNPPQPGGTAPTTTPPVEGGSALSATLSGGEEVPAVTTSASGTATFTFNQDRTQLAYDVRVTNLTGPATAMHLHRGARGQIGDVVYPMTTPDASGVSTGSITVVAADVDALMQGGFYLNVHTAANPNGEVRGQVVVQQTAPPDQPGTGTTPTTPVTPTNLEGLRGLITDIRNGHNAHVATLEQALGTNAQPVPTFQNLDAPTLQQFLTTAMTLEDFAVSAHQGVIQAWLASGTGLAPGTTPPPPGSAQSLLSSIVAVALADARYAGALRAYRRTASTADGGDPNLTLTEDGGAQNVARDAAQVDQFLQQYIVATGAQPPSTNQPANPPPPANNNPPNNNPPANNPPAQPSGTY